MIAKTLKTLRRPLFAALLAGALAAPAAAETLADTMVDAYRHSALLDQNRAVLRAADEDVATAISALRPVVQWILKQSFQRGDTTQNGFYINTRQTSLALQAQITLYDFGRSQFAIDAAKENVLATRSALVGVEQDVLLSAVQAYLNVRSAMEQVDLQENSVRVLSQEERAAKDRYEVGEITLTDVSQADAAVAAARASLAAAQGNLEVARETYQTVTGHMPKNLAAPPKPPKLPPSLDQARMVAQKTHPGIAQAQHLTAAAELGVSGAAAQRNPTITGSVGVTSSRTHTSATDRSQTTDVGVASIDMSQTIYSGGALSAAHRKAMAQRDSARAQLLNTSRQVNQSVGTSWSRIDVARAQIKAISEQIAAAQQAYDGVREEATLGARTTLDVLDAEQSLLVARANMISAEVDLQLAYYQLLSSMGLLTVENLKLGIPTYDPSAYYNAVRNAPYTSTQGKSLDRVLRAIGKSE
ncbi:TolC family outer membrane protein [Paracoccus aminophilus]|nr:TolC family outer membrane protein [Paracoccus aminophilus]